MRPIPVILCMGLGLAGCGVVPGSGPWMGGAQSQSTEALPFDVIDLTPTTVVAVSRPLDVDVPSSTSGLPARGRVVVAPGDLLRVRLFEQYSGNIFPTISEPGADLGVQQVTDRGTIDVPYAGSVHVAGLALPQIESKIINQLDGKAQNPLVIVELMSDRSGTVMVSGEVKSPGRASLLDGIRTVVDAIDSRGGLANPPAAMSGQSGSANGQLGSANGQPGSLNSSANQMEVILRRHDQVILRAQFWDLLAGRDVPVQKGDEIVVRPNSRVFTVLGAAQVQGNVPMLKPNLTLMEALGTVGGLQDLQANRTGVYLFRIGDLQQNPAARVRVFRLDLGQPVSIFIAQQCYIQPGDVVYITNAPLYEYNKVLTAIYETFAIFGIAKGTAVPATVF
jgi:polysaccharide export outer membrane protein